MQVDLAGGLLVPRDCYSISLIEKSLIKERIPVMMGTLGRNLEMRRAVFPLVDRTRIAPASCSIEDPTAANATVSTVLVGRDVVWRSSS